MAVALRDATSDDHDVIVAVFLACWRESYRGVLPLKAIEAMTDERASALWQRALADDRATMVVAERDGDVLGLTKYGIDTGTEGASENAEISGTVHSLYVSPLARGLGLGTTLLDHAHSALAAAGARSMTLWVFAANVPSIEFYRGRGWLPDGVERIQSEFGETELRLTRNGARQ